MIDKILWLVLLTFLPGLELRLSIPVGILTTQVHLPFFGLVQGFGMNPLLVFVICVASNLFVGPFAYFLFHKLIHFFFIIPGIESLYSRFVVSTQNKIEPYVKKYGSIGLALFIAVPLPGSGSYTGALGAYLLGIDHKKFFLINAVGVVIAGIIVTLISTGFSFFV